MGSKAGIAPWLTIADAVRAIAFYQSAFSAIETYHLDVPDGSVVSRLTVEGSDFWVATGEAIPSNAIRLILVTNEPESLFAQALRAGAKEIYPVAEQHGWRIGRLQDPFGFDWEIGIELP